MPGRWAEADSPADAISVIGYPCWLNLTSSVPVSRHPPPRKLSLAPFLLIVARGLGGEVPRQFQHAFLPLGHSRMFAIAVRHMNISSIGMRLQRSSLPAPHAKPWDIYMLMHQRRESLPWLRMTLIWTASVMTDECLDIHSAEAPTKVRSPCRGMRRTSECMPGRTGSGWRWIARNRHGKTP